MHKGINQKWSDGCLIVVPERFTSSTFTYKAEEKETLENESQQEVDKILNYVRKKEIELKKKLGKEQIEMTIIIKQDKEIQD